MSNEIYLARLNEIVGDLSSSINEFKDASEVAKDIAGAVGHPKGKGALKDRVEDFEKDWNDTREKLVEQLEDVHKQLKGIKDGFEEWDLETKKAFLNSRDGDVPKESK